MIVGPVPPPPVGNDTEAIMAYVNHQLDSIGKRTEILGGLRLLGGGRHERLQGGQAIVQMARSKHDSLEYAIKFFAQRSAFDAEAALYRDRRNPLGQFLPKPRDIVDNKDKRVQDPYGHPLPPCIVMERGESLDVWSTRAKPDRTQAISMIHHLALRLQALHAAGYVHRDLKPPNVMWLPRENRWTLIDFGTAARIGYNARLGFSFAYAAPEVIDTFRNKQKRMVVSASLDSWSLGVVAFELLTGEPPFPLQWSSDEIMDVIQQKKGKQCPWEGSALSPDVRKKLGIFKNILLELLDRNPLKRPSMSEFCASCNRILSSTSNFESQSFLNEQKVEPQPQERLPCGCMVPAVVATALRKVGVCSECGKPLLPGPGWLDKHPPPLSECIPSARLQSPGASPGRRGSQPLLQAPFSQQDPRPMYAYAQGGPTPPMSMPQHMQRAPQRGGDDSAMGGGGGSSSSGGGARSLPNGTGGPSLSTLRENSGDLRNERYSENGSDVVMHVPDAGAKRPGREWLRWGSSKAESLLASSKASGGSSSKGTLKGSGRSERNLHAQAQGQNEGGNNGAQTAPLDVSSGDVSSPSPPQEDQAMQRHIQSQNRVMHAAHASHAQVPPSLGGSNHPRERGAGKWSGSDLGRGAHLNVRTDRTMGTHSSGGASSKLPEALQDARPEAPPPKEGPTYDGGGVKDVRVLFQKLTAAQEGSTIVLGDEQHLMLPPRSPEAASSLSTSTWAFTAIWPQQGVISNSSVNSGLFSLCQSHSSGPQTPAFCTVSGGSKTVISGTLELAEHACVILDGSCSDTFFDGTVFKEGIVVCHGAGCSVQFTNVTFDHCTLLVLEGARATLSGSKFIFTSTPSAGIAVFAQGGGTSVHIHRGGISGGAQGIAVHQGAFLEASNLVISNTAVTGAEVTDQGSVLRLHQCTLQDMPKWHHDKCTVRAVHVHLHSTAEISGLTIERVIWGIDVRVRSKATITDTTIQESLQASVTVRAAASARLTNSFLERSQQGAGLFVQGSGSVVESVGCSFVHNAGSGALAMDSAHVVLDSCRSEGNKVCGYSASGTATAVLNNCVSEGDCRGCAVCKQGMLKGQNTQITGSEKSGVEIWAGGFAELKHCTISGCGKQGVMLSDEGSGVSVVRCTVSDTYESCVFAKSGAKGSVKRCTLSLSGVSHGAVAQGKGAHVEVESSRLLDNAQCGAFVHGEAAMTVKLCESRNNKREGYWAQHKGRIVVSNSSSDGDKRGCGAADGGLVEMVNVVCDGDCLTGILPKAG